MLTSVKRPDIINKDIVTGVDRLLEIINERGMVSLSDASGQLNIDKFVIEHWSEALSEQGIIKIKFGIKDIFLMTPDYHKFSDSKISFLKEMFSINNVNMNLSSDEKEKHFQDKEKELEDRAKKIVSTMKKISRLSAEIQVKRNELTGKEASFNKKASDFEKRKRQIDEKEAILLRKEKGIDAINEESSKKLAEIRKLKIEIESKHKWNLVFQATLKQKSKDIEHKFHVFNNLIKSIPSIKKEIKDLDVKHMLLCRTIKSKKDLMIKKARELNEKALILSREKSETKKIRHDYSRKLNQLEKDKKRFKELSVRLDILKKLDSKIREKELILKDVEVILSKKPIPPQFKDAFQAETGGEQKQIAD